MRRVAALSIVLAVLGACGHRAVDRVGSLRQANTICRDVAERFGRLATETDRARFYREAKRINTEGAALLRGILAPTELRAEFRVLAERIDAAARLFDRAARLAVDNRPTKQVEAAITRAGTDFQRRATALGLTECGAPTP